MRNKLIPRINRLRADPQPARRKPARGHETRDPAV